MAAAAAAAPITGTAAPNTNLYMKPDQIQSNI
jgi:hypothetical protein